MNLKDKLLTKARKLEAVSLPQYDDVVYIRRMTGAERTLYQKQLFAAAEKSKTEGDQAYLVLQPLLLSLTICDEHGETMFSEDEIQRLDSVALTLLSNKSSEVNCLTKDSMDAVEKKTASIGSGSSSPTN